MKKIFAYFFSFIRQHKLLFLGYTLLLIVTTVINLYIPINSQQLFDAAVGEDMAVFPRLLIFAVLLTIGSLAINFFCSFLGAVGQNIASTTARRGVLHDLLTMPFTRMRTTEPGQVLRLINQDADAIEDLALDAIPQLIINLCKLLFMVYYLMMQDWQLTVVLICFIALIMIGSRLILPVISKRQKELIRQGEALNNITDECHQGGKSIRANNAESFFHARCKAVLDRYYALVQRFNLAYLSYNSLLVNGLLNIMGLVVLTLGCWRVINGEMTIGTVTLFQLYYSRMFTCTNLFMDYAQRLTVKQLSLTRLSDFHRDAVGDEPAEKAREELPAFESIQIRNVGYAYGEKQIFSHVNLDIQKGDKLLLLGGNGSGKSTLSCLLSALEKPTEGEITYNGIPYETIAPRAIREKIALVPADPFIIMGSVEENFLGRKVLHNAVIDSLENKTLQKGGQNLSSGQRKQLQLMRCLSSEAEVFILDEPFNFVDAASKASLWLYITEHFADKTLIIISHDTLPADYCTKTIRLTADGIVEPEGL